MCGIAGYFGDKKNYPKDINIKKTLKLMAIRGPDGKKLYKKNFKNINLTFLHSRLSIIDPSKKASQPFYDNKGVLVFNGAIYNYIELRNILIKQGETFKTNSDTEVLLKFLNKHGSSKINEIEGMWSFVYFNFKKKKLILSRDRFGEKPLYYKYQKKNIIFGSNLNYINFLSGSHGKINTKKIDNFIKLGWRSLVSTKDTFFNGIQTLQPGSNIEIDLDLKKRIKKYWKPKLVKIDKSLDFNNEKLELKELLYNEFNKKLRTDFPVACLLSGGVDSSVIASISNKITEKKIDCFSIESLDKNYDESILIKKNVNQIGCKHKFIKINKNDNLKELTKLIRSTSSVVPSVTWLLYAMMCKKIKKLGYKVILSGIGGDEMFGGYYIHHLHYLRSIKDKAEFKKNYNFWKKNTAIHIRSKKLKDYKEYKKDINSTNKGFSEILELSKFFNTFDKISMNKNRYLKNSFKDELYKDLFYQSLPTQLYGADNISMYYGLESRNPFLSKEIFFKSFSYPNKFLINEGVGKSILRSSMKNIVNKDILKSSNKIGFFANLKHFFNINSSEFKKLLFSNQYVNSLIKIDLIEKLLKKKDLNNQETHLIFNILNTAIFLNSTKLDKKNI